jgi:hypothetical protein
MTAAGLGSASGSILIDVANARQNIRSLAGDLRGFASQTAGGGFDSLSQSIIRNEAQITSMGRTMVGAGAAVVGAFALGLNSASNFEAGMNRVKALSGATGEEFDLLKARALEMSKTTRYTATEVADGMGFLAMAGFDVNEIYAALPGTLNLAAAAQMDLGRAADISSPSAWRCPSWTASSTS